MKFGERLTELRKENGYKTRNEFAEKLGIPSTTLRNYETNVREPGHPFLIEIAEMFNVSVDYLLCLTNEKERRITSQLKSSEFEHIEKYRNLDRHGKKMVDMTLDEEYKRWEAEQQKEVESQESKISARIIPYCQKLASAGNGQLLFDGFPIDQIEIPDVPKYKNVKFAIGVNGDSMEPLYYDGDTLLIESTSWVEIGEIGIFLVDSEAYVKERGTNVLISFNKKRRNIEVTAEAKCLGRVIGKLLPSSISSDDFFELARNEMQEIENSVEYDTDFISASTAKKIKQSIDENILDFSKKKGI